MKTLISIIMPNYNNEKYVSNAINSIINQSFKKWELILVDDGSNNFVKKKLSLYKKNKRIKIFFLKKNKGAAYCRNFALKRTKGKYVAFLDSDDIWKKNKLKLQYNFMEKKKYFFTYTNYSAIKENNNYKSLINPPAIFSFDTYVKNTSIGTSTMMIKKSILNNTKFTNTKICEDYFFKCQILKKKNAYLLNKNLTTYLIRKSSLQSNKLKNLFWIWIINQKFNNFNIFRNLISIFFISYNSIKKYGFK